MKNITLGMLCLLFMGPAICQSTKLKKVAAFENFPTEANPVVVGQKLTERFLSRPHSTFGAFRATLPKSVTYPDVCTWLGAFWYADKANNKQLELQLIERFIPIMNEQQHLQPKPNHVDASVFGSLPLEIYLQTKNLKYKDLGLKYADAQWKLPEEWTLEGQPKRGSESYGMLSDAHIFQIEQKQWADKGYSWQTRMWLDDMFMITTLQAQAYRATNNKMYIDRAARQMLIYMDSIQLDNGLFNHAPGVPYRWARGNGWMAVGFAEVLRILPKDHPSRKEILKGYKRMMATLLTYQCEDGMWRQLIDDEQMWKETSGTAMFTYAFIVGVKQGWLDKKVYGTAARKAWISLVKYIDANGDVSEVCEGTNIKNDRQHYYDRKRITGDLHGQAPVLWCAMALLK